MAQATRGCGVRKKGGVYLCVDVDKSGRGVPLDHFIIDPPYPIDPVELGISPLGVKLFERAGVWHVIDWVGSEHYPNVVDFVSEVRRMGLSRRIARNLSASVPDRNADGELQYKDGVLVTKSMSAFELLTPASTIILLHARAIDRNHANLRRLIREEAESYGLSASFDCPRQIRSHALAATCDADMCAGLWWEAIEGGETALDPALPFRTVVRTLPSFAYGAKRLPEGHTPDYQLGAFLSLPVQRFAVIRDEEGRSHEEPFGKLSLGSVPFSLEDS